MQVSPPAVNEWSSLLEESPCDACPNVGRCGEQSLACSQFAMFAKSGGLGWRQEAREPSAEIYRKIYPVELSRRKPKKTVSAIDERAQRLSDFMLSD
jgi:hypothetical protein